MERSAEICEQRVTSYSLLVSPTSDTITVVTDRRDTASRRLAASRRKRVHERTHSYVNHTYFKSLAHYRQLPRLRALARRGRPGARRSAGRDGPPSRAAQRPRDTLRRAGPRAHAGRDRPGPARAAVAAAVEAFGRLDVVVNNAGYGYTAAIEDASEADLRAQIETDLWGVINVTRAALPILHQQRSGHIVQFSSIAGRMGAAGNGAYHTAKWAVEGFSEALAREVAPLGIKVTIIEPGAFRTDFNASSLRETPPSADYQPTVGPVMGFFHQVAGHEPGDPAKAAQAIIAIVARSSRRCGCCWAGTPSSWPARSTKPTSPRSSAGSR